jgi:hypothetical protein
MLGGYAWRNEEPDRPGEFAEKRAAAKKAGETAWGYAFERKGSVVLALWDYGNKPRRVKVPVGARQVDVYDWMGNRKVAASPNGMLDLTLTPEPTYVTRVSRLLWSAVEKKSLTVRDLRLSCFPGGKAAIRTEISAASKPIRGTVAVEPDPRLGMPKSEKRISVRAGAGKSVAFDIGIPAKCRPGDYPVMVTLRDETGLIGAAGVVLTVNP